VDVVGYTSGDSSGTGTSLFQALPTTGISTYRLYDSRPSATNNPPALLGGEGPLANGQAARSVQVSGKLGIPSTASAVVVNLSATNASGSGFVTLFPAGDSPPVVASLTWLAGGPTTLSNLAIVPLSGSGQLGVAVGGLGQSDIVLDVVGYLDSNPTVLAKGSGGLYGASQLSRLADTRPTGTNAVDPPWAVGLGPLPGGVSTIIQARGNAGIPVSATAVILQVTLVDVGGPCYVGLYPSDIAWPGTANITAVGAKQIVGNLAIVPLSNDGKFSLLAGANQTGFVLDVVGYILN